MQPKALLVTASWVALLWYGFCQSGQLTGVFLFLFLLRYVFFFVCHMLGAEKKSMTTVNQRAVFCFNGFDRCIEPSAVLRGRHRNFVTWILSCVVPCTCLCRPDWPMFFAVFCGWLMFLAVFCGWPTFLAVFWWRVFGHSCGLRQLTLSAHLSKGEFVNKISIRVTRRRPIISWRW